MKTEDKININNKDERKKYLAKYYTVEGKEALEGRLKASVKEYKKNNKYPLKFRMLGFPPYKIFSREHHQGMIDELCQILGITSINVKDELLEGDTNDN